MNHLISDTHTLLEAHATDADLDDLHTRLAAARLPEAEIGGPSRRAVN